MNFNKREWTFGHSVYRNRPLMNEIRIADRRIGQGNPCFLIAEAGVNHNGALERARELVRRAAEAGADCVKFQTFKAERVVTIDAPKAAYQLKVTDPSETQLAMLRRLELSPSDHRALIAECADNGVVFLSTPYSLEDAQLLSELGVPGFKIASGQLVELPFLAAIASFNKPVILSTGMATMSEITEAISTLRSHGNEQLILLQCTTDYPSLMSDCNLRALVGIKSATKTIVGYSDHTIGINACIASVALGASVLEKHFTLDRDLPGPDHKCSSDPAEFATMVRGVREIEQALGDGIKRPTAAELSNLPGMRRSIVAARDIEAGLVTAASDFAFKRPANGMAPKRLGELIGRVARRRIPADTLIMPDHFE